MKESDWIAVAEQTPPNGVAVLVWYAGMGDGDMLQFKDGEWVSHWNNPDDRFVRFYPPTHWMAVPPGPKTDVAN